MQRHMPYVRAQFNRDVSQYHNELSRFCELPGLRLEAEYTRSRRAVNRFGAIFQQVEQGASGQHLLTTFQELILHCTEAIQAIPADDPDVIVPGGSPFSAYLQLRALCASARSGIHLFDPYLNSDVFYRYLCEVPPSAEIVLLTRKSLLEPPKSDASGILRRDRVVSVSSLLARERPETYRLLAAADVHDRYLQVDGRTYHLGGSVKDAAIAAPYTLVEMDTSPAVQTSLDELLANAERWFPDSNGQHRLT